MAFEHIIDDLNSVPEALRPHYQPHDGKHRLIIEDVTGLKSALDRTKTELREWKGAFKDTGLTAADIGKLVNSNAELLKVTAKLRDLQISSAVSLALMRSKATATGADLLPGLLQKRLSIESVEGRDVFRIATADGRPMPGSGSDGLATFDDLVKETVTRYPDLFEGKGFGGSGAPVRSGRGVGSKTLTRAQFEAIPHRDRAAKIKDGYSVVD